MESSRQMSSSKDLVSTALFSSTPWDRAAPGYLEKWVPRFLPYHLDLVEELELQEGNRVLVVAAGPGAEAIAVARRVGETGYVRGTDPSIEMVKLATEEARKGGLSGVLHMEQADASDASGGPWDAIVCAFGLWQLDDEERARTLEAWTKALAPNGKIGIITWGPPVPDGPFEKLAASLRELEPEFRSTSRQRLAEKSVMETMLESAGLSMVRFKIVRHTHTFKTAEEFVHSLREACTWRGVWEELGDERIERVAAHFYAKVGGPSEPLIAEPPATLVVAGLPGAELLLRDAVSIKVPPLA